jgi:hypothetical protein
MGSKVSQPVRILALVGLLGALALGAGFALLGKSTGSEAAPKAIKPLHPHRKAAVTAAPKVATKPAATRAAHHNASATAKAAAKLAAKPKPTPAAKAVAVTKLPENGLPAVLNQALATHDVVVVALYNPEADVDAASVGEAQAGARLANAGFVPLNVLSQTQAAPLAKKLGILSDPALLVFRRPGELVFHVDGFADRATVAQAAANAKP